MITVSTPGKIHLMGEHAVVYGKPALLTAIDKRCTVSLNVLNTREIKITSSSLNISNAKKFEEVLNLTDKARKQWQLFSQTNDVAVLKAITEKPLDYPFIVVGEALQYYQVTPTQGFELRIESAVPVGAGLGSSSAVAVSVAAAVTLWLEQPFDKETINTIAYTAEHRKHGMPSGGDNAAVCFGGLVWFRKETPSLKIIKPLPFTIPSTLAQHFLLIDTGRPYESTGEMVSHVKTLYQSNKRMVETFLHSQEQITRDLLEAIHTNNEDMVMTLIQKGESNLEKMGVVSKPIHLFIQRIQKIGGVAKMSGGGGKSKGVGVLLAYHQDTQALCKLAMEHQYPCYPVILGVEGLRIDKR